MARTATQPSSTVGHSRRSKATDQPAATGRGPRDEQDLTGERDERGPRDEQDEQWQHGERGEQGLRREPGRPPGGVQRTVGAEPRRDQLDRPTDWLMPATSTAVDALAPALVAWRQIFTSWFELADSMVRLQMQTAASMIRAGAATTNAERITNGDHQGRDHDALSTSRTSSVPSDQIEHDRP